MRSLIHVCCADCLLKFLASLNFDKNTKDIALFFYNPNIHPRSEYFSRLKAIKQILEKKELKYKLIIPNYRPKEYFEAQKNLSSQLINNPARCLNCWTLRLKTSCEYALNHDFQEIGTTLMTSSYQAQNEIKAIAQKLSKQYRLKLLLPQNINQQLNNKGFYKQNYCGCCFSLLEKNLEKFFSK